MKKADLTKALRKLLPKSRGVLPRLTARLALPKSLRRVALPLRGSSRRLLMTTVGVTTLCSVAKNKNKILGRLTRMRRLSLGKGFRGY